MRYVGRCLAIGIAGLFALPACSGPTDDGPDDRDGMFLVGTCDDKKSESEERRVCVIAWHSRENTTPSTRQQTRAVVGDGCTEDEPENVWKSAEADCPTGGKYVGTCEVDNGDKYTESYYYDPVDVSSVRSACRDTEGGSWTGE